MEKVVDGFGVADHKHMSSLGDDMSWGGEADGEDLVAASVDMVKRLGDSGIPPFKDGVEGPVDEAIITGADHLSHQPAAGGGAHPDRVFDDSAQFEQAGGDEAAQLQGTGDAVKRGQIVGYGDTADEDRANRGDAFGHFHCHDAAEGEACEDKRFRCVYLLHEPVGVVAELFFSYGGYPMNIGGFVAFG